MVRLYVLHVLVATNSDHIPDIEKSVTKSLLESEIVTEVTEITVTKK